MTDDYLAGIGASLLTLLVIVAVWALFERRKWIERAFGRDRSAGVAQARVAELECALRWVTRRYEQSLAGQSVRDADEAIHHANVLLSE